MTDVDQAEQRTGIPVITARAEVTIHYELRLADDRLVESSFDDEPLTLRLGRGAFEPNLEQALIGLPLGEHTRILLTPEYAFGLPDPGNVHSMPRAQFPVDMPLEPQLVIEFDLPNGQSVPGTVKAVTEDAVTVDLNHPLAGQNIQFIVQVLAIDGQQSNQAGQTPPGAER